MVGRHDVLCTTICQEIDTGQYYFVVCCFSMSIKVTTGINGRWNFELSRPECHSCCKFFCLIHSDYYIRGISQQYCGKNPYHEMDFEDRFFTYCQKSLVFVNNSQVSQALQFLFAQPSPSFFLLGIPSPLMVKEQKVKQKRACMRWFTNLLSKKIQ